MQISITLLRLVVLCRADHSAEGEMVNRLLSDSLRGHSPEHSLFIDVDNPVEFLTRNDIVWATDVVGMRQDLETLVESFLLETDLMHVNDDQETILPTRREVIGDFERLMRAYGRAVALVIRMNESPAFLAFSPSVVMHLNRYSGHPEAEPISIEMAEAIHFFRKGAIDVLGPAGFDIHDPIELMARFGYHA
jgi:hypothetical protein